MKHQVRWLVSVALTLTMLVVAVRTVHAQTQTPGQIAKFRALSTEDDCNSQDGTGENNRKHERCQLPVVDSVISQDPNGNIGIGTTTPAAALDVATGDLNLRGNLLKDGRLFLHNCCYFTNTFLGQNAGNLTMTGDASNTGIGFFALSENITGFDNTASGVAALQRNTTGSVNTAIGGGALGVNTAGSGNTASGGAALAINMAGDNNTATGVNAAFHTTGSGNTAIGAYALYDNTPGSNNTAIGYAADVADFNLSNATAIGYGAVVNASNKIRLGNGFVTVIEGQVPYTFPSDRNQKENFQPVDGEEVLRKLRHVNITSWNYIGHDPQQFRHYGPVAQEFFAAFGHDAVGTIGTPTTINSGDMEGILMIAVQALEKQNAELMSRIEALERVVKATTAGIQ
jgi:hypothetical protein